MTTSELLISTAESETNAPRYSFLVARRDDEIRAAQRLRYDVFATELGNQLGGRAQGNHPTLIDNRHSIAESLGFVHVVRREQYGPPGGPKTADDVP